MLHPTLPTLPTLPTPYLNGVTFGLPKAALREKMQDLSLVSPPELN